jgi:hypothetical protein
MKKKNKLSDTLTGALTGAGAGLSALGPLKTAALVSNPWGWGLAGGMTLLGGISGLLSNDQQPLNPLDEQLKQQKIDENTATMQEAKLQKSRRNTVGGRLGTMFSGAKLYGTAAPSALLTH